MSIFLYRKVSFIFAMMLLTLAGSTVFDRRREIDKSGLPPQEIIFTNSKWEAVAAEAKKRDKYIFVDAYTSWCGPCKLLRSTTFKDKNVANYFNKNFINYTADMEKGEGVGLAEKWDITAYPTLLFFSPEGKIALKQTGYIDGKRLIEIGQEVLAK